MEDVNMYLEINPYPHDKRCGCVICSECAYKKPCYICSGNCVVCKGILPPGPLELKEVRSYRSKIKRLPGDRDLSSSQSIYECLVEACMQGDMHIFERLSTVRIKNCRAVRLCRIIYIY